MDALGTLKAFDIDNAEVILWTFKKQTPKGLAPQYNGHWVDTTREMDTALKEIVKGQIGLIEEQLEYGLLTQNHATSVLHIPADETHFPLVMEELKADLPKRKIRDVKTLLNCAFYVIKVVYGQEVVYCTKKADASWKTKTATSAITAIFSDKQLDVLQDSDFKIYKTLDFFGVGGSLLIKNKDNFESILNYKEAHERDYAEMAEEDTFKMLFSDLTPLTDFVGNNKINLRRMSAIRQKNFYSDQNFLGNLRKNYRNFRMNIVFDAQGRFVPSPTTCKDIISALLDHRLISGFSGNIYDVQDAVKV